MVEFNPKTYIIKLKGQDYLPVAARLMWLNATAARFGIDTSFPVLTDAYAFAQATVTIMDEDGVTIRSATAAKREDQKHFADYMEKAQTGAIGRALGMLGFGTQFAPEFNEMDDKTGQGRIVDAPQTPKATSKPQAAKPAPVVTVQVTPAGITPAQVALIGRVMTKLPTDSKYERRAFIAWLVGRDVGGARDLTAAEAAKVLEATAPEGAPNEELCNTMWDGFTSAGGGEPE